MIPGYIKEASKVIGYFSYGSEAVFCDGDACIIAGTEEKMSQYLRKLADGGENDRIKKTRFGEIMEGLKRGGAYAFDEESYERFLQCAETNGIEGLPGKEGFAELGVTPHFIRIHVVR